MFRGLAVEVFTVLLISQNLAQLLSVVIFSDSCLAFRVLENVFLFKLDSSISRKRHVSTVKPSQEDDFFTRL